MILQRTGMRAAMGMLMEMILKQISQMPWDIHMEAIMGTATLMLINLTVDIIMLQL